MSDNAELERLRRFEAIVFGFITERTAYLEPASDTAEHWRRDGQAEARRQLLVRLPFSPDNDDAERISTEAGVLR